MTFLDGLAIARQFVWRLIRWRRRPMPIIKPPEPVPVIEEPRPQISKYERNRRRYDKFLTVPKGRGTKREKPPAPKKATPSIEPIAAVAPEPVIVQPTRDGQKVMIAEKEFSGEFNFRDTILDQLDRYFFYIARMKKRDRDAFDLYRQTGVTLLPFAAIAGDRLDYQFLGKSDDDDEPPDRNYTLPPWFLKEMPTFGCFGYGTDSLTEKRIESERKGTLKKWVPRFVYFMKYEAPPAEIQPFSMSSIYKVTVWWDRPFDKEEAKSVGGGGVPQDYAVAVRADGSLHALKIHVSEQVTIKSKRKCSATNHRQHSFSRRQWQIPQYFQASHGQTPPEKLVGLFAMMAHWHEGSNLSMFRVSVTKGSKSAAFGINALRSAYFFADRDLVVDENGVKKRIFHIVRGHQRANGEFVKTHFRGLREFRWAGYEVRITVPGLHHINTAEFSVGARDEDTLDTLKGTIGMKKLGGIIHDWQNR